MQRRPAVVFSMGYIGAELQQDLDTPLPMAGARMEWRVTVTVAGSEVSAALHQPSGQGIWTLMKCECGLFAHAATRIDIVAIEQSLQLFQAAVHEERFKILWQLLLLCLAHYVPRRLKLPRSIAVLFGARHMGNCEAVVRTHLSGSGLRERPLRAKTLGAKSARDHPQEHLCRGRVKD